MNNRNMNDLGQRMIEWEAIRWVIGTIISVALFVLLGGC